MSIYNFAGAVEIGLVYAFVAIGVYLSFRILDFPDLTVDGSFLLGGTVFGVSVVLGFNPVIAIFLAFFAGMLSGLTTAFLNLKLNILNLLASILTMTALYTINLRVMMLDDGKSNVTTAGYNTLMTPFLEMSGLPEEYARPLFLAIVVLIVALLVWRFLESEIGLAMRATGVNTRMAKAQGVKTNFLIYIGMGLSNAIVALGGAFYIQCSSTIDITAGAGTIVFGLAAVIIGEALFRTRNLLLIILSCVIGSVLYRIVVQFAFDGDKIGINTATDLQFITAFLVVITLVIPKYLGAKKR